MKHLKPINDKANRMERHFDPALPGHQRESMMQGDHGAGPGEQDDVVALQQGPPQQPQGPHIPLGCSQVFFPGWEVDQNGGTAGLCQPVERDLFDCHLGCFWPAQVPDQLNHAPDWTDKCATAQKDWRKIDLIFP